MSSWKTGIMPEPPFGAPVNESVPTVGATVEAFAPAVPFMRHHAVTSARAKPHASAAAIMAMPAQMRRLLLA